MSQEESSNAEDDSECVQRKRIKRIESDLIRLERRMESLERAVAGMKKTH